ncbi:MAG: ABC transporter ATP-binding protein [Pacificimonas sp.]
MRLEFQRIGHRYGHTRALADINLVAEAGEITCLLGASGCGKTTLLNLAAGLLPVQEGRILLGEEVLAMADRNPPPERRPVGLVFQQGALFPHLTVAENIRFGVEKGFDVDGWLSQVELADLGGRYPRELSGGQQQRVALARAMAPEPAVLLMDEPFASVDVVRRRSLRRDCRQLLHARAATTILVTHDPDEAMDVGDRIAVMEDGRIVQFGTPATLFDEPATVAVGMMFGDAQIVPAKRMGDILSTAYGPWPLSCVAGEVLQADELDLLVRYDACDLDPKGGTLGVQDIRRIGPRQRIVISAPGGPPFTLERGPEPFSRDGTTVGIVPRDGSVHAFAR